MCDRVVTFRHQSGQIQAISEEAQKILEATKAVVSKVESQPPPKVIKPKSSETSYSMVSEDLDIPIEVIVPKCC